MSRRAARRVIDGVVGAIVLLNVVGIVLVCAGVSVPLTAAGAVSAVVAGLWLLAVYVWLVYA